MLLGPKKTVISIEPGLMYAEQIKLGNQPDRQTVASYQWQPETFAGVFEQLVVDAGGHQVSVLLSDSFCYVIGCILQNPDTLFALIESLVAGLVPENLEETAWSYRLEAYDQSSRKLNAFVLTLNFNALFAPVLERFGEMIDVVEPVSLTLTHELEGAKTSGVILHRDSVRQLAVIVHQGVIVHVQQLMGELSPSSLQPLVAYAQHQLQTTEPNFWLFGFENNSMLPPGLQAKSTQQHIYPPFSLAERSPQDYAKLLTQAAPASAPSPAQHPPTPAVNPVQSAGGGAAAVGGTTGSAQTGHAQQHSRRNIIVLAVLVVVLILVVVFMLVPYFQR